MPAYPFNDPTSPDGYWSGFVWLAPADGSWMILPQEYHGRYQISYTLGCFENGNVDSIRQSFLSHNWRVFARFRYSNGSIGEIFSNTAQIGVPPEEPPSEDALLKTQQVVIQKMTTTPDPINIATGEMFVFAEDFFANGRGPALKLSRTYRSQTPFSGLFGYGWRSAYDVNLTEDTNGSVIIFDKDGVGRYFTPDTSGGYTASAGNHDTLVKNADGTFTVTDKHGLVTTYNQDGRMSTITDRNGNTLTFAYDPGAAEGSYIRDAGGRRIMLTLDSNGRIQSAQDPAGRLVQYGYDANGNLTTITDPSGHITHYVYDANHNITEMANVNGHKTYFAYDNEDRAVMNWQDGDVNKVALSFDSDTQTTVTDALGHSTVYEFNEYGLVTLMTDPLGNTTTTAWDENLNRTSTTDSRGNTTVFEYDNKGNLTKVTNALGHQTLFSYTSGFNLLNSATDALGNTTNYTYDAQGNLLSLTDALGYTMQMAYDTHGSLTSSTDALGHASFFEYDSFGQLVKTTDALSNTTLSAYDAAGNNISITDAKGATTSFQYNTLNRLMQIDFADGTNVSYSYDAFGNRLSATDQKFQTTINTYDPYERLSQTADALGGAAVYTYDKLGNILALTDASSHTTNYAYDANGRLSSETTPLGHTTSYSYDEVGNLVSKVDANGHTITYTYDALNRLTRVEYPDGTNVSYAYDALGRQVSMTDSHGTINYTYDALGRLLSVDGPQTGDTINYTYDALGNRTAMTTQDGQTVTYTYDGLNRLEGVTDDEGITLYSYDALFNITSITYPNGASVRYTYDVMNRPLGVVNRDVGDNDKASFAYTYDAAGMVTKISREDGTFTKYRYDALNRLARETKKESKKGKKGAEEKIKYDYQYTYDPMGNRRELIKHKEDEDDKQITETYSYDTGSRLLSLTRNKEKDGQSVLLATVHYGYDNNGNRISKEETGFDDDKPETQITYYSYDHENRLTNLEYIGDSDEDDILNASFAYDGNGIRTKAVEGGKVARYYYDGLNVLFEKDAAGLAQKSYTRGLGFPGGIGRLVSMKRYEYDEDEGEEAEAKIHYYHYDALGSVRALSNQNGKLTADFDYDAFGNGRNNKKWNTCRFSSKEFEDHANLYYFGVRYYDPEIGRWLTPDPLGFIDGPNRYLYVANNPLNFIDPWGLLGEKKLSALEWWLYESVVPGPFGTPVSEWAIGESIFWGDPMRYTEEAGGTVMWLERGAVGMGTVAVVTATGLIAYETTTAIRIEFHMPHAGGPHQYPHLQGIQGRGWGKTIWRWPSSYPQWWPKP